MDGIVKQLLARWGSPATLGNQTMQVLFQPWHSRGMQSLQKVFSPLGEVPQGRYVCYFPPDCVIAEGDCFRVNGGEYVICRTDAVAGPGGRALYHWTLCKRKGGDGL